MCVRGMCAASPPPCVSSAANGAGEYSWAPNSLHQRSTKPQQTAANSITTHYLLYVALARGYGTALRAAWDSIVCSSVCGLDSIVCSSVCGLDSIVSGTVCGWKEKLSGTACNKCMVSHCLLLVLCCLLRVASRSCCLLILVGCRSVLHVACYRPLAIVLRVACCCVLFADCCLLPSAHCWWHVFGCFLLAVACCTLRATIGWSMVHTPTYACIQHKHTHVHLHVYMYM